MAKTKSHPNKVAFCYIIKGMAKRILLSIALGVLAVVVFTIIFAFTSRRTDTNGQSEPASLQPTSAGWMRIEHPTYGISLDVPEDWAVAIFGDGTKEIRGVPNENPSAAALAAYKVPNKTDITIDELIQKTGTRYSITISDIGKYPGIIYVGRDVIDMDYGLSEEAQFMEDSYLIGRRLIVGVDTLEIICGAHGPQYAQYISACDGIINSLYIQ